MFEKKWSDEQNKKILELHGRIPNSEIAKQFNTTSTNISKRVSYLKKLKKKQKKKSKKVKYPYVKKNYKKEREIEVATAPSHSEADEFIKEYKKEFQPINESLNQKIPEEKESENEEVEIESEHKEIQSDNINKIDWTGTSKPITLLLDARFKANNLAPMSDEEKQHFSDAINEVLRIRAEYFFKYADLCNLGLATFSIFTPRIMEFLERKKQNKSEIEQSATQDLTKSKISVSQSPKKEIKEDIIDEKAEADKRYIELTEGLTHVK